MHTLRKLLQRAANKWIPRPDVKTIPWLAENYRLPAEAGDSEGVYNPDYVPYLWGPANAIDNPKIKLVVLKKAAQVGWTFFLNGVVIKRACNEEGVTLMIFPKDGAAREYSDEKLTPSIKATPLAAKVIDVSKSRSSGNRALKKSYPGGFVKMAGSNAASNVKSTPARLVVVEEPDDTAENVSDQGDSIRLAKERFKRQKRGKMVLGGTPSADGVSRVQEQMLLTNQMTLPVTCHDCGESHVLDWDNVHWDEDPESIPHIIYGHAQPDTAYYACPVCGSAWSDWRRQQNVYNTCRAARDAGDDYCGWVAKHPEIEDAAGFDFLSELYVCIPGTSLGDVVKNYLEAEKEAEAGDLSARIVFQNSKLAKAYCLQSDAPDHDTLAERALEYAELTVPRAGLVLTIGIDVQHDRVAVVIRAWGRGDESWLVYWGELAARNTCIDSNDPVWTELDKLVFREFQHESGAALRASAISIDASDGGTSDAVYQWVRSKKVRDVMAVKGASDRTTESEIFTRPRDVDTNNNNTKAARYGLKTYKVGTSKAKDLIDGRLKLTGDGPGRMHWYQNVRADYYEQITAEVKLPSRHNRRKKTWTVRSGVRNEALDCEVYALHAARAIKVHIMSEAQWSNVEQGLVQKALFADQPALAAAPQGRRVRSSGIKND